MRTNLLLVALLGLFGCGPQDAVLSLGDGEELSTVSDELLYRASRPPGRSIHIAEVDLCEAGIELRATGPSDGTRTVSSFANRTGALVAINGGHSWSGVPAISAHAGQFFGSADQGDLGQAVFGNGFAEFISQSQPYGPRPGDREVLTGLLTLVHDGVAQHATLPHGEYTCSVQHPRTLLGLSRDKRKLFMVVVDGRAPSAGRTGMTCREAADYMVSIGAHWALNLDGGGSSEMVVGGRIVNVPSDGRERAVPTHLAVVRNPGARGHCPVAPVVAPPAPVQTCGRLASNASLARGEQVTSCNGRFVFAHQGDGNVVLYDGSRALWSSRTNGKSTGSLAMQGDGNLVLYSPAGAPLWDTRTNGRAGASLVVQDDGNVVVSVVGLVLWSTNTAQAAPAPAPAPTPSAPPSGCGAIAVNQELARGAEVRSCNGRFLFAHQGDGNVVLYDGSRALWNTRTNGKATRALVMQGDGNLVLYSSTNTALWHTRTNGRAGASLAVQDDGNVVLKLGAQVLWSTNTAQVAAPPPAPTPAPAPAPTPTPAPTVGCGTLNANDALGVNEALTSCDGRFSLVHQGDGNVVLYQGAVARWSTATSGRASSSLVMQGDGNLVLYGTAGQALWNSRTAGKPNARLVLQDDGNLVLYSGASAVWSSGTCCR